MHIAFFSDQHPGTLGGLQVSLGTQRRHLELRGHTVTVCAPESRRVPTPEYARADDVLLPSTQLGEHSFCLAGERLDRVIDVAFARKPPVDVVHVQADVWGAWNGYRFADRHGLPLAHTMHTNVEIGLPAFVPFPRTATKLLYAAQQRYLGAERVRSLADYTRAFADRADLLIAPSAHFAKRLTSYGVRREIHVLPTGVDDDALSMMRGTPRSIRPRLLLVWPGRVSPEKHLGDFLRAVSLSQIDADIHVYGTGRDLARCKRLAHALGIDHQLSFHGAVSHDAVLRAISQADAVVQSSIGYETQGLTVYEAVSLGTPVILRDRDVSGELPASLRHTTVDLSVAAFAAALSEFVAAEPHTLFKAAPCDDFRQSSLAQRAEALYELAILTHARAAHARQFGGRRAA